MSMTLKALIIEDEPLFASVLEWLLRKLTLECVTARNSAEARRCLAVTQFDLILLDLQLPDDDGPALVEDVEHDPSLRGRTMIVTSFPIMGRIYSTTLPVVDKNDLAAMGKAIEHFATARKLPAASC